VGDSVESEMQRRNGNRPDEESKGRRRCFQPIPVRDHSNTLRCRTSFRSAVSEEQLRCDAAHYDASGPGSTRQPCAPSPRMDRSAQFKSRLRPTTMHETSRRS
jgi:hypothetical protein